MADDDEELRCKVTYIDLSGGIDEETCWIKKAGKVRVVYPNGHTFEGNLTHKVAFSHTLLQNSLHDRTHSR